MLSSPVVWFHATIKTDGLFHCRRPARSQKVAVPSADAWAPTSKADGWQWERNLQNSISKCHSLLSISSAQPTAEACQQASIRHGCLHLNTGYDQEIARPKIDTAINLRRGLFCVVGLLGYTGCRAIDVSRKSRQCKKPVHFQCRRRGTRHEFHIGCWVLIAVAEYVDDDQHRCSSGESHRWRRHFNTTSILRRRRRKKGKSF